MFRQALPKKIVVLILFIVDYGNLLTKSVRLSNHSSK